MFTLLNLKLLNKKFKLQIIYFNKVSIWIRSSIPLLCYVMVVIS